MSVCVCVCVVSWQDCKHRELSAASSFSSAQTQQKLTKATPKTRVSELLAPLAAVFVALGVAEFMRAVVLDDLQHRLEPHLAVVIFRVEFDRCEVVLTSPEEIDCKWRASLRE